MLLRRQGEEQGKSLTRAAIATVFAGLFFGPALLRGEEQGRRPHSINAVCRLEPRVLDASRPAGALIARIEIPPPGPSTSGIRSLEIEAGVYVISVNGVRLPEPSDEVDGIQEDTSARGREDRIDVRSGRAVPNGIEETVVRFIRPADGDPATPGDGNAGDLLAMLMDVPDGSSVEVCLAGRVAGQTFECCDSVLMRNRGLRNLPAGLFPEVSAGHP